MRFAFLALILLSACTTPMKQTVDLSKLKPEERAYKGNIQVELNGLKNEQLTCDLFLNNDLNATLRVSPDGDYQFKSIKKSLAFSRIACIYTVNNQRRWIYHSLDLTRINQPADSHELYNIGGMNIVWTVDDTMFDKKSHELFGSEDPMHDTGKLEVKPSDTATPPSPNL